MFYVAGTKSMPELGNTILNNNENLEGFSPRYYLAYTLAIMTDLVCAHNQ